MFTAAEPTLRMLLQKKWKENDTPCASGDSFAIMLCLIDEHVVLALSPQRFLSTSANMLIFIVGVDVTWFMAILWNCGKAVYNLIPGIRP